jgi:endo-1,3-1,4-beta-glycanase ExoK
VKRLAATVLVVLVAACGTSSTPAPAPAPVPDGWRLVFSDDFDRLDTAKWEASTHTFTGNAARFTPANVDVRNGILTLTVRKRRTGDRNYAAAELRMKESIGTFKYGRFEVRMRAARGQAVISSFFAYRPIPWDEIDIEFLGRKTTAAQANLYVSPTEAPVEVTPFPALHDLAFDAAADFHVYAFEWEPAEIRWYVDGVLIDKSSNPGAIPSLPLRVALNIWPSTDSTWAGHLHGGLSASAKYDWVRVYTRAQ